MVSIAEPDAILGCDYSGIVEKVKINIEIITITHSKCTKKLIGGKRGYTYQNW